MLGTPTNGFPEPLRSRALQGKPVVAGRPGATLAPVNLVTLEGSLRDRHGHAISYRDVLSAALYPKVPRPLSRCASTLVRFKSRPNMLSASAYSKVPCCPAPILCFWRRVCCPAPAAERASAARGVGEVLTQRSSL